MNGGVDWQLTNIDTPAFPYNVRTAACRPATLLHWIWRDSGYYTVGGMCAHGFSAGAGEVAYALAWYGAGDQYIGCLDSDT